MEPIQFTAIVTATLLADALDPMQDRVTIDIETGRRRFQRLAFYAEPGRFHAGDEITLTIGHTARWSEEIGI